MKCLNCNTTIIKENNLLGQFCSEKCFWEYKEVVEFQYSPTDMIKKSETKPKVRFGFEPVLKKRGFFVISQKTLDGIYYGIGLGTMAVHAPVGKEMDEFLHSNGYVLKKLKNSPDSIIVKKHK